MVITRTLLIVFFLFYRLAGAAELSLSFKELPGDKFNGSRVGGFGFLNASPRVIYLNTEDDALILFDLDRKQFTSGPTLNPSQPGLIRWSLDDNKLAYEFKHEIYAYDVASRKTSKLGYNSVPAGLAWRNNRELFYRFYERHEKKPDISEIRLIDVTNGRSSTLLAREGSYRVEDFSADTQQLFFSHSRHEKGGGIGIGRLALYKADFRDGKLQNQKRITDYGVIDGDTSFSVTRDGKYALAQGLSPDRDGNHSIYLVDVRTGKYLRFWEKGWRQEEAYINADGSAILARATRLDKGDYTDPEIMRYANLDRATIEKLFAELK